jgi:hypothetical protein
VFSFKSDEILTKSLIVLIPIPFASAPWSKYDFHGLVIKECNCAFYTSMRENNNIMLP